MTYVVRVDEDVCVAHGDCAATAPDVFAVDDVARIVGTGADDLLLAAAQSCPSYAITVLDSRTGAQVFP